MLEQQKSQEYKLLYKTAVLAGRIMLESGSEIYRVEDTMKRILELTHMPVIDVYATTTGIITSLSDVGMPPITQVKRIVALSNNLERICSVNEISRHLCSGSITAEEAYQKLEHIRNDKQYPSWVIALCTIFSTMGFTTIFGGWYKEFFVAAITGTVMVAIGSLVEKFITDDFVQNLLKSFAVAFTAMLCHKIFSSVQTETVIIGTIMPLVPGIPITNGIRDTLQGDYMSGSARIAQSFVIALGIAVGVGAGLKLFSLCQGVIF